MRCFSITGKFIGLLKKAAAVGDEHLFDGVLFRCIEVSRDCNGIKGVFASVKDIEA